VRATAGKIYKSAFGVPYSIAERSGASPMAGQKSNRQKVWGGLFFFLIQSEAERNKYIQIKK
jgi:hypothetical protein